MENENIKNLHDDEMSFYDVIKIMSHYKIFIFGITLIIGLLSIIYVMFKNPTPIYSGNMMIEIGEVSGNNYAHAYFDNVFNLKTILEKEYSVKVSIPEVYNRLVGEKSMDDILILSVSDKDKNSIQPSLLKIKDFIIKRHQEKIKLYDKYIMTQQIGTIEIDDKPINALNKKLIVLVSFVIGFIFSIFLVFFLEFLRKIKR